MVERNKHALLKIAINLAKNQGYHAITRDEIAFSACTSMGTITNHLGTMKQIKRAVVRYAIRTEILSIIAQALVFKDPLVRKLDPDLKKRALASL